jgi:uncharacterized tellurite resistance protein B-like protein
LFELLKCKQDAYAPTENMQEQRHPLTDYPEDEKVDYLSIVGTIAAADGKITDNELSRLREFCMTIGLGGMGVGMIIGAVENPSGVDFQTILARLSQTDLKFTLLTDMLFMAHADGIVAPGEEEEIRQVAAMLNINQDQIEAMNKYVKAVLSAQSAECSESGWKNVGCEIAGILAGTGVPLGAVTIAGTVLGSGINTGLAVLGMGLGMPVGIGVAVSIGVSSYFGVRWLFKRIIGKE